MRTREIYRALTGSDLQDVTVRELRAALFEVQDQEMLVRDFRRELYLMAHLRASKRELRLAVEAIVTELNRLIRELVEVKSVQGYARLARVSSMAANVSGFFETAQHRLDNVDQSETESLIYDVVERAHQIDPSGSEGGAAFRAATDTVFPKFYLSANLEQQQVR